MRILGISGSLREASSNTRLIQAARLCAPSDMQVECYEGLGRLPLFNPDLEREPLQASVADFRFRVGESDALLICSPEYARGVSGAMKNGLDWLVGSGEFPGKPVALINASQRATDADAHMRVTLRTMNANFVERASITVPLLGVTLDAAGVASEGAFRRLIVVALDALRDAIADAGR